MKYLKEKLFSILLFSSLLAGFTCANPEKSYKILFIMGKWGHGPSAQAVIAALKRISSNIQVDTLADHEVSYWDYTKLYDNIMRYGMAEIANLYFTTLPLISQDSMFSGGVNPRLLKAKIQNGYDLVICNFPRTQRMADLICKALKIPFMVIPSDLGEPYLGFWIRPTPYIIYLLGSKYLRQSASDHPNVAPISGMVLRPEFRHIRDISKRDMKARLGLDPDKKMVLVLFGTAGSDVMLEIAKIARQDKTRQYVFICASYKELKYRIDQLKQRHFKVEGYINNIHEYMRAADVFIGKPGGGCTSECIQCETPIILRHKYLWDTMPQEVPNLCYVKEHGLGKIIKSYQKELLTAIDELILNPPSHFPHNNAADQCAVSIAHFLKCREALKNRVKSMDEIARSSPGLGGLISNSLPRKSAGWLS